MTTLDLQTLAGLCDVFVPAVRPPAAQRDDPHGFWAGTASAAGTPTRLAALLPELLTPEELEDLATLLRVLRGAGIGRLPYQVAQGVLRALGAADADARQGLADLRKLTMVLQYGGTDDDGWNRHWDQIGYPGPPTAATALAASERLPRLTPPAGADRWELTADVVVVGSGAGGGVIAARLAAAGRDVLVIEAGAANEEPDFPGDEVGALRGLYWRGGLTQTEDGNVTILAGGTLGGGTTVNWSNCVPPPEHVLADWQDQHGVDDLTGASFAADLAAVAGRIGASDAGTRLNGPNDRLVEGAKALGWSARRTARNVDTDLEDDAATGATGLGDRSSAKLGSLRTWLPDAIDAGARLVTSCEVERVLTADGRASGVSAVWREGDRNVTVTVTAPSVVLAAGALETPAVLLRSGIGGRAAGRNLRLHPVAIVTGVYTETQQPWLGAPQGVVVDEQSTTHDGHGYLIECSHWHPGLSAGAIGWPDARDHKVVMSRIERLASFLAVTRERGSGTVTLDDAGRGVVRYPLDDPFDRAVLRAGIRDMARLHDAAGATHMVDLGPKRLLWRRGEDIERFVDRLTAIELGSAGRPLFSAHQMGTARMGRDAATSVADADGQLHDTPGVWIGDASAFPTAVGSNPMLTVMALAHRTATRLLAHG